MPLVIRPVQEKDFKPLHELVSSMRTHLPSLPPEKKFFKKKFDHALESFQTHAKKPGEEYYLFILENLKGHQLAGTCGIYATAGGTNPFVYFSLREEKIRSHYFNLSHELPLLLLEKKHSGNPSELCSLYLKQSYRKHHLGRLLSFSRYHFIHAFPEKFQKRFMASLLGFLTRGGEFPFWKKVVQAFFRQPLDIIDALKGTESGAFLYELLPKGPIYLHTLPQGLSNIIGQVNPRTLPALKMLQYQGFKATKKVDVLDGGPILEVATKDIRTLKTIKWVKINKLINTPTNTPLAKHLVSNTDFDFRCSMGEVHIHKDGSASITSELAANLLVEPGMEIAFSPLH